jgi:hypothetical protein
MNERQPYEKHLADKLQQLPPPADVNTSWVQMKKLLDEDMPRGGGFFRNRWWLGSILLLLLLTGAWLVGTKTTSTTKQDHSLVAATPNPANDPAKPTESGAAQPAETNGDQQKTNDENKTASVLPAGKEDKPVTIAVPEHSPVVKPTEPEVVINKPSVKEPSGIKKSRDNIDLPVTTRKSNATGFKKLVPSDKNETTIDRNTTLNKSTVNNKPSVKQEELLLHPSGNYFYPVDYYASELISPSGSIQEKYAPFTENELFPNLVKKKAAAKNRSYNAGRTMEAKTFAIGLSMPLGFPLGDQKALGYNSNAGVNTVSDYLPAPNFQYHINSKTYLQTEIQFITPQFIRPILLYQQVQQGPVSGDYIYNSVYAKKLYYFNVPVAIHHSPFKNFYMGTGLQFSTMLSGVALYEQVKHSPGTDILLSERYAKFSNDSLSNRFNNTEMRLLLDMNYYFNRFTVGLRYNQAFNNYVNFRVNSSSAYTYDKNKALLFYLRYNLWEDIKRKKPAKSSLSLK